MDTQILDYTVSNWDSLQQLQHIDIKTEKKEHDKLCEFSITAYLFLGNVAAMLLIIIQFI